MTDIEMTKLCAQAMGWQEVENPDSRTPKPKAPAILAWIAGTLELCDPLHDDAQVMALVKRFRLYIESAGGDGPTLLPHENPWAVEYNDGEQAVCTTNIDLNRAVVECVAKMKNLEAA